MSVLKLLICKNVVVVKMAGRAIDAPEDSGRQGATSGPS